MAGWPYPDDPRPPFRKGKIDVIQRSRADGLCVRLRRHASQWDLHKVGHPANTLTRSIHSLYTDAQPLSFHCLDELWSRLQRVRGRNPPRWPRSVPSTVRLIHLFPFYFLPPTPNKLPSRQSADGRSVRTELWFLCKDPFTCGCVAREGGTLSASGPWLRLHAGACRRAVVRGAAARPAAMRYACPQCPKVYTYHKALLTHLSTKHGVETADVDEIGLAIVSDAQPIVPTTYEGPKAQLRASGRRVVPQAATEVGGATVLLSGTPQPAADAVGPEAAALEADQLRRLRTYPYVPRVVISVPGAGPRGGPLNGVVDWDLKDPTQAEPDEFVDALGKEHGLTAAQREELSQSIALQLHDWHMALQLAQYDESVASGGRLPVGMAPPFTVPEPFDPNGVTLNSKLESVASIPTLMLSAGRDVGGSTDLRGFALEPPLVPLDAAEARVRAAELEEQRKAERAARLAAAEQASFAADVEAGMRRSSRRSGRGGAGAADPAAVAPAAAAAATAGTTPADAGTAEAPAPAAAEGGSAQAASGGAGGGDGAAAAADGAAAEGAAGAAGGAAADDPKSRKRRRRQRDRKGPPPQSNSARAKRSRTKALATIPDLSREEEANMPTCVACAEPEGEVVLCDTCPRTFHLREACAGITSMPAGDWPCPVCRRCGRASEPLDAAAVWHGVRYWRAKLHEDTERWGTDADAGDVWEEAASVLAQVKADPLAEPFREPLDIDGLGIPHYRDMIGFPMDFGTITKSLESGQYRAAEGGGISAFIADMMRVFWNCKTFNQGGALFWRMAHALEFECVQLMRRRLKLSKLEAQMAGARVQLVEANRSHHAACTVDALENAIEEPEAAEDVRKPTNAWSFYSNAKFNDDRDTAREAGDKFDAATVIARLSMKWKDLEDEERAPYDELARIEKMRYDREMASALQRRVAAIRAARAAEAEEMAVYQ